MSEQGRPLEAYAPGGVRHREPPGAVVSSDACDAVPLVELVSSIVQLSNGDSIRGGVRGKIAHGRVFCHRSCPPPTVSCVRLNRHAGRKAVSGGCGVGGVGAHSQRSPL